MAFIFYYFLFQLSQKQSPEVFCKRRFLKISQQNLQETSVLESLFNKDTAAQAFSREFCEIFKSIYFIEHLRAAASARF